MGHPAETPCWIWLGGWGVQPEKVLAHLNCQFPEASHRWIYPGPEAQTALEQIAINDAQRLTAWSLGSLILLSAMLRGDIPADGRWTLLRPIFRFDRDATAGCCVARKELASMARRFKRFPENTLASFYSFSGVSLELPDREWTEANRECLQWGLDALLETDASQLFHNGHPELRLRVGAADALSHLPSWQAALPRFPALTIDAGSHCISTASGL